MTWVGELLKDAPELAVAFSYAAAFYTGFLYLDRNVSAPATKAIAFWLKPVSLDSSSVGNAMVEVFDRVYTYPLWHWRPMLRSFLITLIVSIIIYYELDAFRDLKQNYRYLALFVLANAVSDYISLFVVRRWLVMAGVRPLFALVSGAVVGILIVYVMYLGRTVILSILDIVEQGGIDSTYFESWWGFIRYGIQGEDIETVLPALVVHLWLPLLALSVLIIKIFNLFVQTVGWTQWFFKGEDKHPLRAVGKVASALLLCGVLAARSA
jgi:hypothetical protein